MIDLLQTTKQQHTFHSLAESFPVESDTLSTGKCYIFDSMSNSYSMLRQKFTSKNDERRRQKVERNSRLFPTLNGVEAEFKVGKGAASYSLELRKPYVHFR